MPLRLTTGRDLAKKVTQLAIHADDARELLLALGLVADGEEAERKLAVEPGSGYVPPAQRRLHWTRAAGEMAAAGRTAADIALALVISEDLAAELISDWWAGVRP
ncbi:hypothetical protein ACIOUE_35735 [Streptomyces xanthochromogenes]|uniref:hypothetical protein n=1 Tax=Streptomyces xanthochromogenes TaxID=67384 RepID=UPI00382C9929